MSLWFPTCVFEKMVESLMFKNQPCGKGGLSKKKQILLNPGNIKCIIR